MNKILRIVLPGVLFLTLPAQAVELTPEAALDRALSSSTGVRRAPSRQARNYKLAYSEGKQVYVFSDQKAGGYLAVSGDDMAPAVLGYADSGNFDADNMSPAMKWWLESYARQIEAAKTAGVRPSFRKAAVRNAIEPLVQTLWDQSAPFNNFCPRVNGSASVTGCAATAMAQIMNYHEWPVKGRQSITYLNEASNRNVSVNFSSITFDWANMLDDYSDVTPNTAQKNAVATLMYAAGASVKMQYTPDVSSASAFEVPAALIKYFNYDNGVRYLPREYYEISDWEDVVYGQLAENMPVLYTGQSDEGGHAFVCDGYSSDGYFHINWGWSGLSDGYFLLTALDPYVQGIGGSDSGFNYEQAIIAGINRPQEGSEIYWQMLVDGNFSIQNNRISLGSTIRLNTGIYNFSASSITTTVGIKIEAANGDITYAPSSNVETFAPLSGYTNFDVKLPSELADGVYTVSPAFQCGDTWYDAPVPVSAVRIYTMTVEDGMAYFTAGESASLTVSDFKLLTPVYWGSLCHMTAKFANNSEREFIGTVCPALENASGMVVAVADNKSLDLHPGQSSEWDFIGRFDLYNSILGGAPAAGEYMLYLVDSKTLERYSDGIPVELHVSSAAPSLYVDDFSVVGDPDNIDPLNISFIATITCDEGYFADRLTVAIFPENQNKSITSMTSEPLFIEEGEEGTMTAKGSLAVLERGKIYGAAVFSGETQLSNMVVFTTSEQSGIENVEAVVGDVVFPTLTDSSVELRCADVRSVNVYNIAGARIYGSEGDVRTIDFTSYPKGVYLVEIIYGADIKSRVVGRVVRR